MSYIVASDLIGLIPDEWISEATTDDTARDALTEVITSAEDTVNNKLATRYTLPLDLSNTVNGMVGKLRHYTRYMAAYIAYGRRGMQKECPWADELAEIRKELNAIANGSILLFPTLKQTNDDAEAITVTNRAHSSRLSC